MKPGLTLFFLLLPFVKIFAQPNEIDAQHWQFFLDDHALARATGLQRVVHHPRSMGVVIPADQPWETSGMSPVYFSRQADGTFIGYYNVIWWDPDPNSKSQPDRAQQYTPGNGYVTSKDGIHWEKPKLGLVEAPAGIDWQKFPPFPSPKGTSKDNNLGVPFSFTDLGQWGNVNDPARRFAISYRGKAYFSAQLPDWLHDSNWPAALADAGGTFSPRGASLNFWDDQHKEWVGIVQNAVPHWLPAREIARFASKDLKQWRSEIVLTADPGDPQRPEYYDEPMSLSPFHTEGVVLGLLSWLHSDRTTPDGGPVLEKKSGPVQGWPWPKTAENPFIWPWARKGPNDMRITISRDGGFTWDRTSSREAWIPHGTEEDSYDRLVITPSPPVRVGDEDWFYMGVWDGDHLTSRADAKQRTYYHNRLRKGQIALYVQKHNRYASLRARTQHETLITRPFTISGEKLQLNLDASRGLIKVGLAEYKPVTNFNGTTLSTAPHLMEQNMLPGYGLEDCQPIEADSIEHTVEFKNGSSLKSIQGRKVVLFVYMLDADLYSFRVR